jgi:hypothetical protein
MDTYSTLPEWKNSPNREERYPDTSIRQRKPVLMANASGCVSLISQREILRDVPPVLIGFHQFSWPCAATRNASLLFDPSPVLIGCCWIYSPSGHVYRELGASSGGSWLRVHADDPISESPMDPRAESLRKGKYFRERRGRDSARCFSLEGAMRV